MKENSTRVFRLDSDPASVQGGHQGESVLLPDTSDTIALDEDVVISPLAKVLTQHRSIDTRLKEVLKPRIRDINLLKPDKFYALSRLTLDALIKEIQHEKNDGAKEALNALVALLKENMELLTLLGQCLNQVHKA